MKFWQVLSFAEPDQLIPLAKAAEEAGFHGVMLSDHLFFPGNLKSKYPYSEDGTPGFDGSTSWPEPWTTIAAMSAVTERLHFGTMVYILPLRNPIEVAKSLGTVAFHSKGRVACGVGAGWIQEEFDALGVDFKTRGGRLNEMIEVMRKLWTGDMIEHEGKHFQIPPMQMSPAPGVDIPIHVGGISKVALRRAATLGNGWIGTGQTAEEATEFCRTLKSLRKEAGRENEPFDTIIPLAVPPELEMMKRLSDEGMTGTTAYPFTYTIGPTSTFDQKRDLMMQFGDNVIRKLA